MCKAAVLMCQPVYSDNDGVASFLELLLLMLDGSPTNQEVFFLSEGPATIGTLLQKVHHQPLVKMFHSRFYLSALKSFILHNCKTSRLQH